MNFPINQTPVVGNQAVLDVSALQPSNAKRVSVDDLCAAFYDELDGAIPSQSLNTISLLCTAKPVLDDVTKLVVKDESDRPSAVILCSPPAYPEIVATYMQRTQNAQEALSPNLGHVVVTPLHQGYVYGLSYTVLPYHQPLENSRLKWYWQRFRLAPDMFHLLQQIAAETYSPASDEQVENNFIHPLNYLLQLDDIPENLCSLASEALSALRSKSWTPCHILMHNDLWKGNVLLSRNQSEARKDWHNRFVLIDWSGSTVQGYGIYDLVRLADSMNLSTKFLRRQLEEHCKVLECTMPQAKYHLITALGYLAIHLENFPMERFLAMAQTCIATMDKAQQA